MSKPLSGPMLPPLSGGPPKHLVVLLHGYGSDGADLIALGQYWAPAMPDVLFVSPNAPDPAADNPFGYQWFPLSIDRAAGRQQGAEMAHPVVVDFLTELWAQTGLGAADTTLCGFSQGAMMALHAGLLLDPPLAGIVSFSGALLPPAGLEAGTLPRPPVVIVHGDLDQVLDPALSQMAAETLKRLGYSVTYYRSPNTAHGISEDMLEVATRFIQARIAALT